MGFGDKRFPLPIVKVIRGDDKGNGVQVDAGSGVFVFRSNDKRKVVMWSLTEQVDGPETDAIDVGRCVDFGKFRDGHLGRNG